MYQLKLILSAGYHLFHWVELFILSEKFNYFLKQESRNILASVVERADNSISPVEVFFF